MDRIITLEDCGLISLTEISLVYRCCLKYDIKTINEFINLYDSGKIKFNTKISMEEISGFVEMIKYKFFDEDLKIDDILLMKFSLNNNLNKKDYCMYDIYSDKYSNPLRRLGLTYEEVTCIRFYVEKSKYVEDLINVFIKYRKDDRGIRLERKHRHKIFLEKIDLIIKYYYKNHSISDTRDINNQKLRLLLLKYKLYLSMERIMKKEMIKLRNCLNEEYISFDEKNIDKFLKKIKYDE